MSEFFSVLPMHFLQWLVVVGVASLVFFIVGVLVSFAQNGSSAPVVLGATFVRAIRDLTLLSPRRILALTKLTFIEAYRRKAFAVGVVFLAILMFSGWFVKASNRDSIAPYIATVITPAWMLLVPMSLLVSCWGIPADVKERSLHTVVTKPVRRSEIVIGRMLGYALVMTILLGIVAATNYVWLMRQVPAHLRDQLVARVPVYGALTHLDRQGLPAEKGINVGDQWEFRSYIEGQTKSRAIWTFHHLDIPTLKKLDSLPLEQQFEAFRTAKGIVSAETSFNLTLINEESGLRVTLPDRFSVHEFSVGGRKRVIEIPHQIPFDASLTVGRAAPVGEGEPLPIDLFEELVEHDKTVSYTDKDGKRQTSQLGDCITVEIACFEAQQFIGVNPADMFIRMPDHSFVANYLKAVTGIWLLLMLLVIFGTTSSCFVKGPVATILCCGILILGYHLGNHLDIQRAQLAVSGKIEGGGPLESMYRLVTKRSDLPDNMGTRVIKLVDQGANSMLYVTQMAVPDLRKFSTEAKDLQLGLDISRGFDIPFYDMVYRFLIVISYFIPMVVLGYFSLQLRELEHR